MAKVFLSYSREDASAAKQLAESIARAGHQVWWDRQIEGGSRFSTEIDRELKASDAVVVIWSKASIESPWVQDEAAEGRDSGRLVPVIFGADKPPLGFRQFQSIDFGGWDGESEPPALDALIRAIAQKGGEPDAAASDGKAEDKGAAKRQSICVLPFQNMSGDPEQEYFSDGITEDIITDLSKVSALSVVARNTAFMFKGQSLDVKEVAQKLGVDHVLEGSVRKAGNRVRITAQLIDGKAGDHHWADRYDRDLTDIFAIQDEISKAIVQALRIKLLPAERKAIESRGTSSPEAYNLYLLARQQLVGGPFGNPRREETIVRICQQATVIDPDYAEAWALMAFAQSELRFWHGKEADPLLAIEKASALRPDMPEVRCVRARYLENEGKDAEADREIKAALKADPESWEVNREAARMNFRAGRIKEAVPYFEKASSLMDSDWHNTAMLMTCYQAVGDDENFRRVARMTLDRAKMALAHDPTNGAAISVGVVALATFGDEDMARDWIERGLLLDPDNLSMRYNMACALSISFNDTDRALDILEPYFHRVSSVTHIRHLEADPDLDKVRDKPRFRELLAETKQRLGVAAD